MSSEKAHLLVPLVPSHGQQRTPTRRALALLWVGLTLLGYCTYSNIKANQPGLVDPFTESTVVGGIAWWACPDVTTTECAYLTVPRDYAHPEANDTVSIFLRKVPATVSRKEYLGSMLINPGGPGGSGSGFAATYGPKLSAIVNGRYDIIGFDPRGVNMTLPRLDCYETEAEKLHMSYKQALLGYSYDARGPPSLPSETRKALELIHIAKLDALFNATSLACRMQGNMRMLQSVSTALVVQDMERIIDALGEDGLNYWGFSYGTILGSTFAAMRPHLVKRMILDGVSNAESYHRDIYRWGADAMTDTDKTLSGFLDSCAEAGPERCAFAKPHDGNGVSFVDLRSRLEGLYERLRREPMPVPKSKVGPGILTAHDAKYLVFRSLYDPKGWPDLAKSIAKAEAGDPQSMYDGVYGSYAELRHDNGDKNVFNRRIDKNYDQLAKYPISCGDSGPAEPKSLDAYLDYIHAMGKLSSIGEQWALWAGFCKNWKIKPIQRYLGPWSVEEGLKKTKFPILYASLDADPVTPLLSAEKMAKAFGNESAALLVQEGFGHCTISHPSLCSARVFRDYFVEGKVPTHAAHCKPEPGYLFPGNETNLAFLESEGDQKLWKALEGLSSFHRKIDPFP